MDAAALLVLLFAAAALLLAGWFGLNPAADPPPPPPTDAIGKFVGRRKPRFELVGACGPFEVAAAELLELDDPVLLLAVLLLSLTPQPAISPQQIKQNENFNQECI